jgi:sortase A
MRHPRTSSARKVPKRGRRILRIAYRTLFLFGVLALAYAGFLFVDALTYQSEQLHLLDQPDPPAEATVSEQPAPPAPPAEADLIARTDPDPQPPAFADGSALAETPALAARSAIAEGQVLGELVVPRLDLQAVVVQGDSPAALDRAVGHLSNSPLPGEPGNVALAAHRDTFFRPLRNIRVGDQIKFKTRQRTFAYQVESTQIVAPTDLAVLQPSPNHDLTLLTCYPFHYIGPAPQRFVVFARKITPTPNPHRN